MSGTSPTGRRSGLALPTRAYIPGQTGRHPEGAFEAISNQADAVTTSANAKANVAWLHGLDLIESGFYWEAHEVLETVWMNAPPGTPERALVQALIQLANAALKQRMERPKAALRLCDMAEALLGEAGHTGVTEVMTVALAPLAAGVEDLRTAVREARQSPIKIQHI